MRFASKMGNFFPNLGTLARPLGSRIICYVCDRRTDGQTKAMLNAIVPRPYGWGHNKQSLRNTPKIYPVLPKCINSAQKLTKLEIGKNRLTLKFLPSAGHSIGCAKFEFDVRFLTGSRNMADFAQVK